MVLKNGFFQLLKKQEFIAFVTALLGAYLLFPTFFTVGIYSLSNSGPSWYSLDPSWQLTLSKVNADDLVWGKDFAFTYGPLSYLALRVGWGVNKFYFILFDLFVLFNFFYLFYTSYLKSNNKRITLLLIIVCCILLPNHFGSGLALILSAFLIFWIRQSLEESKVSFYVMQILLVVLLFFIKFNTGLVSVIFFSAGLAYKVIFTKDNKWLIASYFISPFVIIGLLSIPLNVSVPEYLKAGMEMVSGYNEIMYLNENYINEFRFSLVLICGALFILLLKTYYEKDSLFKNLVILFLFSASVFIIYKQAFTRQDIQHIQEFYKYVLLFILCIQDFHYNETGKNSNAIIIGVVFIAIFFAKRREEHLLNFKGRLFKDEYFKSIKNYTDSSNIFIFENNFKMPAKIINRVGNSRVDAYPWNTQTLLENRLNFYPRPTFQSYTAYTPYLENLNFEFYNSPKAPEYVFYEYDAIDGRYPLFDETKLNLLLLRNYQCVDTFEYCKRMVLLLQKNKVIPAKVSFQKIREYNIDTNTVIVPRPDIYYELFMSNTIKGKLVSVLYHSPALFLNIKTKDGREIRYKTSKKLLETGLFSNLFINSTFDFYNRITRDSVNANVEVESYGIKTRHPSMFKNNIKIIEYKIN